MKGLRNFRENYKECSFRYKHRHLARELKYAWQRAWRGYDDCDVYSVRDWFTGTIPDLLREMISNLHSYPYNMEYEQWKSILEEMAYLLDAQRQEDEEFAEKDSVVLSQLIRLHKDEQEKGLKLFVENFSHLWD